MDGEILSLTNPKSEMARGTEALAALLDSRHARPRVTKDSTVVAEPAGEVAGQPS